MGFRFVWLVVCFGFNGWLVVSDSGFCGFGGCVSFMGFDYDVGCVGLNFRCGLLWFNASGCVGFEFWGFWVLRSFFGVYGLDFNFWVCVLRFGFVFFFNTHLISIHVIF